MTDKFILDACCGGRMFWFNKKQPNTIYMDCRTLEAVKYGRHTIEVAPDVVGDFRDMPFDDDTFSMVVFDPPHLTRAGDKSYMGMKYGVLNKETWQSDLRAGFAECMRVLKPQGTLVFKWNDEHISVKEILALAPTEPLFGNRATGKNLKTHWMVFMKLGVAT